MRLSARNLTLRRGRRLLLDDVSLEIGAGEKVGLLGPNGSGKSTLLRALCGILTPQVGEICYGGLSARSASRGEIARRLALVEQQADTSDDMSVREVVGLGRIPWLGPLAPLSTQDEEIIAKAMARLDLTSLSEQRWRHLSGGERQRCQIARALAQSPQILLLDEPGNHLDIRHQLELQKLLKDLPLTTVIALHDLNQAMEYDRVALMSEGRLLDMGPPAEVLSTCRIRELFGVEARIVNDPQPLYRFSLPARH